MSTATSRFDKEVLITAERAWRRGWFAGFLGGFGLAALLSHGWWFSRPVHAAELTLSVAMLVLSFVISYHARRL